MTTEPRPGAVPWFGESPRDSIAAEADAPFSAGPMAADELMSGHGTWHEPI